VDRASLASMGSGRGDRNQTLAAQTTCTQLLELQWGPVVVTGIRAPHLELGHTVLDRFNGVRSW